MNVFDLVATLTLDSSGYDSGLSESEDKAEGFGSKLKGALGTAGKIGAGALAGVAAAGTAVVGTLVAGTKSAAEYGDSIDKQSQKLGISAEAYQEWDAILQHSGSSASALTGAMRTMVNATENNTEAFEKLGISEQDIASMSKEDLFSAVITGLQNMEGGLERDKLATDLLGRGAIEMGALLNTSAEDTEAMRQKLHDLGGVMSDDAVKSSAAFQDSLQDLMTSVQSIGRGVVTDFLPSITTVMDGLAQIFSGDKGGAKLISDGIKDMIKKIRDALPTLIDTGMEIIDTLLDVIIDNLPQIIEAGVEIILKLATGIVKALPKLLEKAPEIIKAFVEAIIKYSPELLKAALELIVVLGKGVVNSLSKVNEMGNKIIDTIREAIIKKAQDAVKWGAELLTKFVSGIASVFSKLSEAIGKVGSTIQDAIYEKIKNAATWGNNLMVSFVNGIIGIIKDLVNVMGNIGDAITNSISNLVRNAARWGADLMINFVNGIIGGIGNLVGALGRVGNTIASYLGFSEPDKGPLSNFHTYAPDMIDLFVQGLKDSGKELQKQLNTILSIDAPSINGGGNGYNGGAVTVNVYGAQGQDVNKLAEAVMDRINFELGRQRRAIGDA